MCKGKLLVLTYYNRLTFTHISIIVVSFFYSSSSSSSRRSPTFQPSITIGRAYQIQYHDHFITPYKVYSVIKLKRCIDH